MSQASWEPYRVILDYEALQEAFIDRVEDLNVSRLTIDEAGGFTPGHASKLLCNPPIKKLGPASLEKMLKATGLILIAAVDDERFAPVKAQMMPRKRIVRAAKRMPGEMQKSPINIEEVLKTAMQARMREIGLKGNKSVKRRAKIMKKRARQRAATHAARMRWSKAK